MHGYYYKIILLYFVIFAAWWWLLHVAETRSCNIFVTIKVVYRRVTF